MQTPPRFDFGPATPPSGGGITPPPAPPGANPPYFPPPPYREESVGEGSARSFSFSRLLPTLITLSAFGGLALLGWFAYQEGRKPMGDEDVPVIKAESDGFKREPENPGGEDIPHMDKEVYNSYSGADKNTADAAPAKPSVETNPAEQPVDRAFLKQFAGTADEDSVMDGDDRAGTESVAFGQKPQIDTGAPAAPLNTDALNKEEAALVPQDVAPAAAPKPLTQEATPNTGGIAAPEAPAIAAAPETEKVTIETVEEMPPLPPVAAPAPVEQVKKAPAIVPTAPEAAKPVVVKKAEAPAKPKAAPKTTAKPIKAGDLRVQLGSFKTEADAKKEWKRLSGKHKSLLGGLSSKIEKVTLSEKGTMYRLQAGPVKNRDAGRTLCKQLSEARVGCFIAK